MLSERNALNSISEGALLRAQPRSMAGLLYDKREKHRAARSGNDLLSHLVHWFPPHDSFQLFLLQALCLPLSASKWQGDSPSLKLRFYLRACN